MENRLNSQELAARFLRAFVCLPVVILILLVTFLSDLLAGVKSGDKLAKLKENGR